MKSNNLGTHGHNRSVTWGQTTRHPESGPVLVPLCSFLSPNCNAKRFVQIKTPWGDGGSRHSSFPLQILTAKENSPKLQEENSPKLQPRSLRPAVMPPAMVLGILAARRLALPPLRPPTHHGASERGRPRTARPENFPASGEASPDGN